MRIAVNFKIRNSLGENPQNEFGGPAGEAKKSFADRKWLEVWGINWNESFRFNKLFSRQKKLEIYTYPTQEEIKVKVVGICMVLFTVG